MKYLIGNWKANKTINEAKIWIKKVKESNLPINQELTVILCPAFIHLPLFKKEFPILKLGCQDISPYGDGAYTGAITARMISNLVKYVILGHSERHHYFAETEEKVALKVDQAIDNSLTPIIAVHRQNWQKQLRLLNDQVLKKSILMYEPPEAISQQVGPIGEGNAAPLAEVKQMIAQIKSETKAPIVIYGGSIKANNIKDFLEEEMIDGVLPGSASLNPDEWLKMVALANQIVVT